MGYLLALCFHFPHGLLNSDVQDGPNVTLAHQTPSKTINR